MNWLADCRAAEGLSPSHIVGNSRGGAVAARLAARHPDRLDRLVLVDAAIRPEGKRPGLRAKDIVRTVRSGTPGFAPMLVRDLPRCHSWSFLAATVDALQPGCESHLRRISAPTLIVCGEHDGVTSLALRYEIAAAVPGARLITLAGTGHNPMWERADAFNAEVLRFLSG